MFNRPVRDKTLKPDYRPKHHFTPYYRARHKDVLSEHDKRFSYAGVEFGLVLSATVFFGALASAVALDDDNLFRSILLDFLPWAAWTFTALGTVFISSPLASTPLPFYQWLTRAAVFVTMLIVIGIHSQIVGVESVRNSPNYSQWRTNMKKLDTDFETLNRSAEEASRDLDSCVRQREALKIQLRLQASTLSPFDRIKIWRSLQRFCDTNLEVYKDQIAAAKAKLQEMKAATDLVALDDTDETARR